MLPKSSLRYLTGGFYYGFEKSVASKRFFCELWIISQLGTNQRPLGAPRRSERKRPVTGSAFRNSIHTDPFMTNPSSPTLVGFREARLKMPTDRLVTSPHRQSASNCFSFDVPVFQGIPVRRRPRER